MTGFDIRRNARGGDSQGRDRTNEVDNGLSLDPDALGRQYEVVVVAVPHREYRALNAAQLAGLAKAGSLLADLHGLRRDGDFPVTMDRWSL